VKEPASQPLPIPGECAGGELCPLSQIQAGVTVCIKHLAAAPETADRLRELGFCEDQNIRVVARHSSYICQVCNARLGISEKLAEIILVEPLPPGLKVV
jgi:Fe2+ transport system protein FeoA